MNIVLAGNPNVGKSVIFNALTGTHAEVSNYPGTTLEKLTGTFERAVILDTPGVYGLSEDNDEERITRQAVEQGDVILNIADASQLERDLFLTLQLLETGKPVILVLNMMDLAEAAGIRIHAEGLSGELKIPVIPAAVGQGRGIEEIKKALRSALREADIPYPKGTLPVTDKRLLEESYRKKRRQADRILQRQQTRRTRKASRKERLDDLLLDPRFGYPFLLLMLAGIYFFVGRFLAHTVAHVTQGIVMGTWYFNGMTGLLDPLLPDNSLAESLLIGEYGILTMVPIYLIGLLLPLVMGFYLVLSLLEDSGILPRMAVLLDRSLRNFGLNGKGIIPLLLGFGCTTMALISTRMLSTKREKFITAVLLSLAVPCSAQLSVILALAGMLSPPYLLFYGALILLIFSAAGILLDKVLPGNSSQLFLSLPPLRVPAPGNILKKTLRKARHFLKDAGLMFLLGGALISLLHHFNGFLLLKRQLAPLTTGLLGLPEDIAGVFLMSFIKRDLGAAALYDLVHSGGLTEPQTTIALVVMTLFMPCIAALMVLFKEEGPFRALGIWITSFLAAFGAGAFAALVLL